MKETRGNMNAGFKLMNKGGLNDKMEVSFLVRLKTRPGKFRHSSAPSQRASEAANEDPQKVQRVTAP